MSGAKHIYAQPVHSLLRQLKFDIIKALWLQITISKKLTQQTLDITEDLFNKIISKNMTNPITQEGEGQHELVKILIVKIEYF